MPPQLPTRPSSSSVVMTCHSRTEFELNLPRRCGPSHRVRRYPPERDIGAQVRPLRRLCTEARGPGGAGDAGSLQEGPTAMGPTSQGLKKHSNSPRLEEAHLPCTARDISAKYACPPCHVHVPVQLTCSLHAQFPHKTSLSPHVRVIGPL